MMILKTGKLIKHTSEGKEHDEYVMRLISIEELKDVVALQEYVYEQLSDKQVLYMDTTKKCMMI